MSFFAGAAAVWPCRQGQPLFLHLQGALSKVFNKVHSVLLQAEHQQNTNLVINSKDHWLLVALYTHYLACQTLNNLH